MRNCNEISLDAHVQPTQVSESEIQLVAATVSEHWALLANILGIAEDEYTKFSVSLTLVYVQITLLWLYFTLEISLGFR